MKVAAVLGWPVEHSRSPAIMNAAFAALGVDAEMIAMGVPPEHFASSVAGLRALPMLGASVTIPHKFAAHALCDELAPAARAIGAVNCLALDGDRLVGHNTDARGFVDALRAAGIIHGPAASPTSAATRAVLLGAGGAARACAYGLAEAGVAVDIVARTAQETVRPWSELAAALATADLVVDCTPTGLDPATDAAFVATLPLAALSKRACVVTLVYHRRTILLERASELGHSTLDGRAMLVHQGARSFSIWTGLAAPIEIMTRALDESIVKNA